MFGFGLKRKFERLKTVALPGDAGTVALPECFETELERDDTLLATLKHNDAINLRFTSFGLVPKGDRESVGYTDVIEEAQAKGYKFQLLRGKSYYRTEKEAEEEGVKLKSIAWRVGLGNSKVLISASILASKYDSKAVQHTLEAMPKVIESIEISLQHHVDRAEGREIHSVSRAVDPWPQTMAPFGRDEEHWLERSLDIARQLGFKYGTGGDLTPEELDRIYANWMHETEQKEEPDIIINALGAAIGKYFTALGFDWVVVNDAQGQEFAVYHTRRQTWAYPRSSVYKRIQRNESNFIADLCLAIKVQLEKENAE